MKQSTIFKKLFYDDITRFDRLMPYAISRVSFRTVAKLRCKMFMNTMISTYFLVVRVI